MTGVRIGAAALPLLLSMVACATRPPAPGPSRGSLPTTTPAAILAPFDRRWQMVEELRALARLSVTSAQGRYSTRQTLLWHRPTLLHLDTLSLFGQPTMTLSADAERIAIYYPQQGTFFQGPATATNLARFTGLPLDVEDAAYLLTGYIRPSSKYAEAEPSLQTDDGAYLLRFLHQRRELIQDVWVEPGQFLPTRVVRYTDHAVPAVDVQYSDFRPLTATFPFPFQLVIWLPRVEMEVRVQFLSVDLNPGLNPEVFQLSPPEGVRVVPLE